MAAEKAADMILGISPLAANEAPVWIDDNWREQQRLSAAKRAIPEGKTV